MSFLWPGLLLLLLLVPALVAVYVWPCAGVAHRASATRA